MLAAASDSPVVRSTEFRGELDRFEDEQKQRHREYREYLLTKRRDAFVQQFCRKLLGYALGRSVQLSDEPLLKQMRLQLQDHDYRIVPLIESIVLSHQFREIRGKEAHED